MLSADCAVGFRDAPYVVDQFGVRYDIAGGEGLGVGPYPIFVSHSAGQPHVRQPSSLSTYHPRVYFDRITRR